MEPLPYWLVNVPQAEWPNECPDFLVNVNKKDQGILATPDSNYRRLTWPEVQTIISAGRVLCNQTCSNPSRGQQN